MGINFDIFSADASTQARNANNAANANLDVNLIIAQMVSMNKQALDEMRNFNQQRFNDVITGLNNRKHENEALMAEINELKAQVAGLQRKLYEEQEKNKGFTR